MKSSLQKMVLVLAVVTLAASAAVGVVYQLTLDPIQQAKDQRISDAIGQVLPEFDNNPSRKVIEKTVDGMPVKIYTATKDNVVVGYAVETFTKKGYGGEIRLLVGFLPDGTIHNTAVISHSETPGLGDKIDQSKSDFSLQFNGKNPGDSKLALKADGGNIDAISAATISSRAFVDAVQRAHDIFSEIE